MKIKIELDIDINNMVKTFQRAQEVFAADVAVEEGEADAADVVTEESEPLTIEQAVHILVSSAVEDMLETCDGSLEECEVSILTPGFVG